MKKKLLFLLIILLFPILFQLLGFYFIGKPSLPETILKNRKTGIAEKVPKVYFNFQPEIPQNKVTILQKYFYDTFKEAHYSKDTRKLEKTKIKNCVYNVYIEYDSFFNAVVEEGYGCRTPGNDAAYVEGWKSTYKWRFIKWEKVSQKCTGQS